MGKGEGSNRKREAGEARIRKEKIAKRISVLCKFFLLG